MWRAGQGGLLASSHTWGPPQQVAGSLSPPPLPPKAQIPCPVGSQAIRPAQPSSGRAPSTQSLTPGDPATGVLGRTPRGATGRRDRAGGSCPGPRVGVLEQAVYGSLGRQTAPQPPRYSSRHSTTSHSKPPFTAAGSRGRGPQVLGYSPQTKPREQLWCLSWWPPQTGVFPPLWISREHAHDKGNFQKLPRGSSCSHVWDALAADSSFTGLNCRPGT